MGLTSLPAEVLISLIAILIAASIGCITALLSWTRISVETKGIKRAESTLTGDSVWQGAYPHDKLKLAVWLRENGIKPDSHLGDFIRTCWSAWLGGRPASLTELHVLVARRERVHASTRLSSGIAALLLVFGIVGTLSSIKPVLGEFKFKVAAESNNQAPVREAKYANTAQQSNEELESTKDAASVAANTDLVNKLIHNLGNAFWPSLLALIGTIFVVSCRGLYSLSLHKFALELDRFAVDTLIPRYRVPSLSEQYQEVKATLASVTESILQREGRFHKAVEQLENLVGGITPALSGLDAAASSSKEAAEKLTFGAESITEGLNRHLGEKSPMHRAISGFESIFEKADVSIGNLSILVEEIGRSNASSQRGLETTIKALTVSVGKIATDHESHQSQANTALREFKDSMAGIPDVIEITSGKAVDAGMKTVRSSIEQLHDEQKKWHDASAEKFKTTTASGLAGIVKAGQELTTEAERIAKEVNNIGAVVERLAKLQLTPVENRESRGGELPNRNVASGNGSKNYREPIRNVVVTPTVVERPAISDPLTTIATSVPDDTTKQLSVTISKDRPTSSAVNPARQNFLPHVTYPDGLGRPDRVPNPDPPSKKRWFARNPFSRKKN